VKFPVDAIYYISLPRAAQRRKKLIQHFKEIGLTDKNGNKPEFHSASDGNHISHRVDNSLKKANKRSSMSMGEIGCCASHRAVWQKMLDNGNELALILEDDARFDGTGCLSLTFCTLAGITMPDMESKLLSLLSALRGFNFGKEIRCG